MMVLSNCIDFELIPIINSDEALFQPIKNKYFDSHLSPFYNPLRQWDYLPPIHPAFTLIKSFFNQSEMSIPL